MGNADRCWDSATMLAPGLEPGAPLSRPGGEGSRKGYRWDLVVNWLRNNTGEWLLVDPDASQRMAHAIRNGQVGLLRSSTEWCYEARAVGVDDSKTRAQLWVRAYPYKNRRKYMASHADAVIITAPTKEDV